MDFWTHHGTLGGCVVILGYLICPRLTLLFVTPFSFTPINWGVWAICPSILVAWWASTAYWDTNPILVVGAWAFALLKPGSIMAWPDERKGHTEFCKKLHDDEYVSGCGLREGHAGPCRTSSNTRSKAARWPQSARWPAGPRRCVSGCVRSATSRRRCGSRGSARLLVPSASSSPSQRLVHRRRDAIKHATVEADDRAGRLGPCERCGVVGPSLQIGAEMRSQGAGGGEVGQAERLLPEDAGGTFPAWLSHDALVGV